MSDKQTDRPYIITTMMTMEPTQYIAVAVESVSNVVKVNRKIEYWVGPPNFFLEMSGNQQSSSLFTSQPISTVFIQYTLIFAAVAALAIRAASCAHNQHHKNE